MSEEKEEPQGLIEKMGELETIEKLVEEYKPRIEAIFGMEMGNVEVKEDSTDPGMMYAQKGTIYGNLEELKKFIEKRGDAIKAAVVHELCHLLVNHNGLIPRDSLPEAGPCKFMAYRALLNEGFGDYVALEFLEISEDPEAVASYRQHSERLRERLDRDCAHYGAGPCTYTIGYNFFKKVGDKIGRDNILEVFQNLPKSIEAIKDPEIYLKIIGGKNE